MLLTLSLIAVIVVAAMLWVVIGLLRTRPTAIERQEHLQRLAIFRDDGIITDTEYESLKKKKLGR